MEINILAHKLTTHYHIRARDNYSNEPNFVQSMLDYNYWFDSLNETVVSKSNQISKLIKALFGKESKRCQYHQNYGCPKISKTYPCPNFAIFCSIYKVS